MLVGTPGCLYVYDCVNYRYNVYYLQTKIENQDKEGNKNTLKVPHPGNLGISFQPIGWGFVPDCFTQCILLTDKSRKQDKEGNKNTLKVPHPGNLGISFQSFGWGFVCDCFTQRGHTVLSLIQSLSTLSVPYFPLRMNFR